MSKNNYRVEEINSSGELNQNQNSNSISKDSNKLNSNSSSAIINSSNESGNNYFINQGKNVSEHAFGFLQNKKQREEQTKSPENYKKAKIIELKKGDDNVKKFFIRVKGKDLCLYTVDVNTPIKEVIEKYIKTEKLNEEIKNNFYFKEKKIDDLEKTIGDLQIENLSVIESK